MGWVKPDRPLRERGASVGIIGAGPAGLAVAEQLRKQGWQVHVYDRYDRVGGLLIYGIPGFKLEKDDRRAPRAHCCERAASSSTSSATSAARTPELRRTARAATMRCSSPPASTGRAICSVPGCGLPGIVPALEFLTASNRKGLGDDVPAFDDGTLDAAGKHVVVVGGGDTAMDCVRTAIRQGAMSVQAASTGATAPTCRARMREVRQCRGGRRRVRLALGTRGLPRR